MNDHAATELLLARFGDHGLQAGVTSLAGGHFGVHTETYAQAGYAHLISVWSADDDRGEPGAAVWLQTDHREDWDNYNFILWETSRLVSPDRVVMVTEDALALIHDADNLTDVTLSGIRVMLTDEWGDE